MNSTVPSFARRFVRHPYARSAPLYAVLLCAALLAGCGKGTTEKPFGGPARGEPMPGDPVVGKRLVTQYQCAACHMIPEIQGPNGDAGPALDKIGSLGYIAGRIPNQPAYMVAWLRDPPALKPGTRMPSMGVSEQEARHMAAYLYTLK